MAAKAASGWRACLSDSPVPIRQTFNQPYLLACLLSSEGSASIGLVLFCPFPFRPVLTTNLSLSLSLSLYLSLSLFIAVRSYPSVCVRPDLCSIYATENMTGRKLERIPFGDHPFKFGTIQRRLAWPLRKDDTQQSRGVNSCHARR